MWEKIGNRFVIDPFTKNLGEERKRPGKPFTTGWLWQKNSPKKHTIYTNNPKEIIPIVERPSSHLGMKDHPQIVTIVQNKENPLSEIGEDITLTMLTNMSTESEKLHLLKIIN